MSIGPLLSKTAIITDRILMRLERVRTERYGGQQCCETTTESRPTSMLIQVASSRPNQK